MKIEKNDLLKKIRILPPLKGLDFQVFQTVEYPLHHKLKVSNDRILSELSDIFTEFQYQEQNSMVNYINPINQPKNDDDFRKDYYNKAHLKDLKYSESATFFSPRFEQSVDEMLGGKNYNVMTEKEVIELHDRLQNLSKAEFEWKEYHRRTVTKEMAHEQFAREYIKFAEDFEKLRRPPASYLETKRSYTFFMSHKSGNFAHCLIEYLYKKNNMEALGYCVSLTPEQLGQIIVEYIEPKRVFNDLARISIKKAHEKLLNLGGEARYADDVLSISQYALYEEFRKTLMVEIFYAILTFGEKEHNLSSEIADTLAREMQVATFYKGLITTLEEYYRRTVFIFSDFTRSMLETFIKSGFFSNSVVIKTTKKKKATQLILPDHIVVEAYRPFKFPNIIPQQKLKKKDIDKLIKPLINGRGSLTKSDRLVETLNISRSKAHKVSTLFLMACQKFFPKGVSASTKPSLFEDWFDEGRIDVGTVPRKTLIKLKEDRDFLKEKMGTSRLSLYAADCVYTQLALMKKVALKNYGNLLNPCGMTNAESLRFYTWKIMEKDYTAKLIDWKFTQSRIFLAKYLQNFPLYINDTLCIRLRMYPREHWLSRTAGSMKHLLQNFKPLKLTQEGFVTLLRAYYQANIDQLSIFEEYLENHKISKKHGNKLLTTFFYENPLDFTKIHKPMYFINLHLELLNATNNGFYTAVNVEIDQNASALAILSIVLRCKEMARVCNVIGGDYKVSPYDYIKEKCIDFLNTKKGENLNKPEYSDVCEFVCSSRELHKYAIMCFCYNQTVIGRIRDFGDHWVDKFGYAPNNTQRDGLTLFASLYPELVEYVFPKSLRKLEILKQVVKLVCDEAPHIQMRTLDGEVINWVFYATESESRKYYDVFDREPKSYQINKLKVKKNVMFEEEDFGGTEATTADFMPDTEGMKRRFLSYLIHSIDAGILRRIIYLMKKEHKVNVNHLHDCVILHPNYVSAFYKVIKQIYSSPELYNIVVYSVFDSVAHTLSPESKVKLNGLKEEYLSLTSEFKDDLINIVPSHLYSLED